MKQVTKVGKPYTEKSPTNIIKQIVIKTAQPMLNHASNVNYLKRNQNLNYYLQSGY